jgi:uncharacterized protein with von Willebrand factor type A (vWA) domain
MGWLRLDPSEFNHETSKLDALYWSSILDRNPMVRKQFVRRADQVIAGDLFLALWDWEPKLKNDPPSPSVAEFVRQLQFRPAFVQVRAKTVGDKQRSAAAAVRLFKEMMRTKGGRKNDLAAIAELRHNISMYGAVLEENGEPVMQALQDADKALAESMETAGRVQIGKFSAKGVNRKTDREMENTKSQEHTDQSIDAALEDIEMAEEMAEFDQAGEGRGWSLGGAATDKELNILLDEKVMESFKANDKLKKIMRIVGRMKLIAKQQKSKKPRRAPPPIGLTMGDDIEGVLPAEISLLTNPRTKKLFFSKYMDKALLQYDRKARPREGKGPIVCCIDVSGSMHGNPEVYAVSMFVAMARVAIEQKRRAVYIPFASYAGHEDYVRNSKDIMRVAGYHDALGGGTNFMNPLDKAMDVIESEGGKWKQADVVLITDGVSTTRDEWAKKYQARMNKQGVRLQGIIVGRRNREWDQVTRSLLTTSVNINSEGGLEELEWFRQAVTPIL